MSIWSCCLLFSCFFFFKQKTAYEMRISDWSSDVCSSDLAGADLDGHGFIIWGGPQTLKAAIEGRATRPRHNFYGENVHAPVCGRRHCRGVHLRRQRGPCRCADPARVAGDDLRCNRCYTAGRAATAAGVDEDTDDDTNTRKH